jgi:hypothetical protein
MTMYPHELPPQERPDLPEVAWAFAPVDKLAIGVALGVTLGACVFLLTAYHVVLLDQDQGPNLWLLANYFAGYQVSWRGAFVGLFWGFVVGFVGGWFAGFLRNLFTAFYTFRVRARANLENVADFLDHI